MRWLTIAFHDNRRRKIACNNSERLTMAWNMNQQLTLAFKSSQTEQKIIDLDALVRTDWPNAAKREICTHVAGT